MGRTAARLLAGALTVLLAAPAALVVAPRPAAAALPPVSMIGDSTLLGMTSTGRAIMSSRYDVLFDARSCRRLIITSCRGRGVIPPNTLTTMQAYQGRLGDAVVIMAGYDDWYNFGGAVDAIVGEARRQGVGHVVWLTYRSQGPYVGVGGAFWATYRSFNAILAAKTREHPELHLADWDAHSLGQSSWFASDGIHISSAGATALAGFINASLDKLNLHRCYGGVSGTPTAAPAPVAVTQAAPGGVTPAGVRVLDTRPGGAGGLGLPVGAGASVKIPLVAQGSVPAGTTSVFANVTAVGACRSTFVTAYPCGSQVPTASNLNVPPGRTRAAGASVMLNAQGELCVYTSATTDLLVDVLGTVGPGGLGFNPVVPDRLVDTRSGAARNTRATRVGPGTFVIPTAGVGVVPAGAKAVLLDVAVVGPDNDGYVTVQACGAGAGSSNLNFRPGQVLANAVVSGLAANGTVCVFSSSATHLLVDVLGWFGEGGGLRVQAQTPQRVVDTRNGQGGVVGPVPAGGVVTVPGVGSGLLATVTAVGPTGTGYLTAYPCGARPNASNVNYVYGDVVPNLALLGPGTGGNGCVFTSAASHLLVDRAATLVP